MQRRCPLRIGVLVAVLSALALAAVAPAAQAHPGAGAVYSGLAGPYQVYAFDGSGAARPGTIRYDLIVWRAGSGQPVDSASVTVTARLTGAGSGPARRAGPVQARGVANVYQYTLPDPGEARWRTRVTIEAAAGTATTGSFLLHGLSGASAPGVAGQASDGPGVSARAVGLIMLGIAGGALAVIAAVYRRSSPRTRTGREGAAS